MKDLLFGTAGVPLSTKKRSSENGVMRVRELNLDAMELEFVRGVKMGKETALAVNKAAKENDVVLTAHGPYYINLNSPEKKKKWDSVKRILDTARVTDLCGGYSICFHAAYYMKKDPKEVYAAVKKSMKDIVKTLKSEKNNMWIRPETTGKATQFGDLKEILNLSQELDNVLPCIDFSHLHARSGGKNNSYKEFHDMLALVEKMKGKTALNNMHIHVSGIAYGMKGEKHHLNLNKSDFKYKELLRALKDFKCSGAVISESPNIEGDAVLMKEAYNRLR